MGRVLRGTPLSYVNPKQVVWVRTAAGDFSCIAETEINSSSVTVVMQDNGRAHAFCESSPKESYRRIIRNQRGYPKVLEEEVILPFFVVIAIATDASSLDPGGAPELYEAIDAVMAAYNNSPIFPGSEAEDFIRVQFPSNEDFLFWFDSYPILFKRIKTRGRSLVIGVIDDAHSVYHIAEGEFPNNGFAPVLALPQYDIDFETLTTSHPSNGLIRGVILQSYQRLFGIGASSFESFLNAVFSDPSTIGSTSLPLGSIPSEYEGVPLINRVKVGIPSSLSDEEPEVPVLTTEVAYNAIVESINQVLLLEGYSLLPYPYTAD